MFLARDLLRHDKSSVDVADSSEHMSSQESIIFSVGGFDISSQLPLRYLGVQIETRLCFDEYLRTTSKKAGKVTNALARIMPKIGGPSLSRR